MINFNGFDSQKVLDFNSKHLDFQLDIKGTSILYALKVFLSNDKLVSKEVDGEIFYWVNQSVFLPEIAMLGITTKRGLQKQFGVLESLGLIGRYTDKNAGNYSYFRLTDECKSLYIDEETIKKQKNTRIEKDVTPYEQKDTTLMNGSSQAPYERQFTTKEISNNIEISNKKDKYSSSMVSAREEESSSISLQDLINAYDNAKSSNTPNADFGFCKMYWDNMSKEQKEYIADIVNNRMDDLKREKKCKKFDYLLKDILSGIEVLNVIRYENGYKPVGTNIIYNEELECFQSFDYYITDGYTENNRPDNAHIYSYGEHKYWDASNRKWVERKPKDKWQYIDIDGVTYK